MPTNDEINIKEFYWPAKPGITEAVATLHNDEINLLFKTTAKQVLDDAKHFVFKITYDDDISEDEQMQIDFYMAKVVEQYSAFLKELEKKYEVD